MMFFMGGIRETERVLTGAPGAGRAAPAKPA